MSATIRNRTLLERADRMGGGMGDFLSHSIGYKLLESFTRGL